jgi:hypothetical protein
MTRLRFYGEAEAVGADRHDQRSLTAWFSELHIPFCALDGTSNWTFC